MSLLEKLTIVIPSYNRPEFLKRSINFWDKTDVNVVIIDGSETGLCENFLFTTSSNIKYIHSFTSFANRLKIAISNVNTEFVALLGDDEYFVFESLEHSIEFLIKNIDYVSCGGQSLHFRYNYEKDEVIFKPAYKEFYFFDLSINDSNLRVIEHFQNYTCAYIYSVMRTNEWKCAMRVPSQSDFTAYGNGEYAFEFIASYLGKSKMLPELNWFRSLENDRNVTSEKATNPKNSFSVWWTSWRFKEERSHFKQLIYSSLPSSSQINIKTFERTYQAAFDEFYKKFGYTLKRKVRHNLAKIRIFRSINYGIKSIFSASSDKVKVQSIDDDLYDSNQILDYFKAVGISADIKSFHLVHKSILSTYKQ